VDGSVLLGPIAATGAGPIERSPKTSVARVSVAIQSGLGEHPRNLMLPAIALSLVLVVFLWRSGSSRVAVFVSLAGVVTWLQMAANVGTGGGAHHVILLWPFPCVLVGVAFAGAADRAPWLMRYAITGVIAVAVFANLLNTNEYLADLIRNGAAGGWTDGFYRLADAVKPYKSGRIGIVDWGYLNGLRMVYRGDLKMIVVSDFIRKPVVTEDDRAQILAMAGSPDMVFIRHTDDKEMFVRVNGQLREVARGYAERVERVVYDDEGRAVFEIFRFVKTGM
jgi:hypothetical protein